MPTATTGDGLRLHVEVRGVGPPVLFIGGSGGNLRAAPNVFDGPLAAGHTLASYDQRGLGQSDKPDEACSMADYGDDAAAVFDALGWSSAPVVGASFGGMVAQHLAIHHPERVDRLVLCCTSSSGAGGASYPLHELTSLPPDERGRRQLALSDVRCDEAWQAANPEKTEQLLALRAAAEAVTGDDPEAARGTFRQLEARSGHDTWEGLGSIAVPVLVAAGRYDGIAPVANSEAIVSQLPDATLEVFEGGHLFLLQDRRSWPVIIEFLQGISTPPSSR